MGATVTVTAFRVVGSWRYAEAEIPNRVIDLKSDSESKPRAYGSLPALRGEVFQLPAYNRNMELKSISLAVADPGRDDDPTHSFAVDVVGGGYTPSDWADFSLKTTITLPNFIVKLIDRPSVVMLEFNVLLQRQAPSNYKDLSIDIDVSGFLTAAAATVVSAFQQRGGNWGGAILFLGNYIFIKTQIPRIFVKIRGKCLAEVQDDPERFMISCDVRSYALFEDVKTYNGRRLSL